MSHSSSPLRKESSTLLLLTQPHLSASIFPLFSFIASHIGAARDRPTYESPLPISPTFIICHILGQYICSGSRCVPTRGQFELASCHLAQFLQSTFQSLYKIKITLEDKLEQFSTFFLQVLKQEDRLDHLKQLKEAKNPGKRQLDFASTL